MFQRNVPGQTEALAHATVGIAGCGGLGSNVAVSLVRAGIGRIILADFDRIDLSNLNRQHFFRSDLGRLKVDALEDHLRNINPDVKITRHACLLDSESAIACFHEAEVLIEAFDRAESKRWLIEAWCSAFPERPIICGNGISGAGSTSTLRVQRIGRIVMCGDGVTDMSAGLSAPRVAIVANMQANEAVDYFIKRGRIEKNEISSKLGV